MRVVSTCSILGAVVGIVGCAWTFEASSPLLRVIFGDLEFSWFVITISPMMALPGVLMAFFGYRLFRRKAVENIKGTLGSSVFLLALLLVGYLNEYYPIPLLPEDIRSDVQLLVATLFAVALYLLFATLVLRHEGYGDIRTRALVPTWIVLIVAIEIWSLSMSFFMVYGNEKGSEALTEPWWMPFVALFGPLLLAGLFYRVTLRVLGISPRIHARR